MPTPSSNRCSHLLCTRDHPIYGSRRACRRHEQDGKCHFCPVDCETCKQWTERGRMRRAPTKQSSEKRKCSTVNRRAFRRFACLHSGCGASFIHNQNCATHEHSQHLNCLPDCARCQQLSQRTRNSSPATTAKLRSADKSRVKKNAAKKPVSDDSDTSETSEMSDESELEEIYEVSEKLLELASTPTLSPVPETLHLASPFSLESSPRLKSQSPINVNLSHTGTSAPPATLDPTPNFTPFAFPTKSNTFEEYGYRSESLLTTPAFPLRFDRVLPAPQPRNLPGPSGLQVLNITALQEPYMNTFAGPRKRRDTSEVISPEKKMKFTTFPMENVVVNRLPQLLPLQL